MQKTPDRCKAWRKAFVLAAFGLFAAQTGFLYAAAPDRLLDDLQGSDEAPADVLPTPGKDGLGHPPSPTPNKQDREDLLGGAPSLPDAASRREALDALYDRLASVRDAKAAEPIMEAIEQAWRTSGSDTVDLLMSRVDTFVLSAQLDLAAEVLDAVTDIAPDDAEAWHQRAIVSFMQKDVRRALDELRRALSIDPRHYKAMRDLGMVLQQSGDKKGALEAYRQALKVNPFLEQARRAVDELVPDVEGQDI
jgi:tetratricopeptide (TPR) repeat protein